MRLASLADSLTDPGRHHVITPDELSHLDAEARAALMKALKALEKSAPSLADPLHEHRRLRFLTFLLGCCLFLIPWIVFLALTLPRHYRTGHWGMAWTGFDVALLAALGATAWAVWLRRQIAIVCALVTGTLLVCDAWFDLMFSFGTSDFWLSAFTAVFGELPIAGLMFFLAWRLLSFTVRIVWLHFRYDGPIPPLRRVQLFTVLTPRKDAEIGSPSSGEPA